MVVAAASALFKGVGGPSKVCMHKYLSIHCCIVRTSSYSSQIQESIEEHHLNSGISINIMS